MARAQIELRPFECVSAFSETFYRHGVASTPVGDTEQGFLFGTEHEFSEPKGKRGGLTSMYVRCSGIGDGDVNGVMQG